jgi:hypothetical protein
MTVAWPDLYTSALPTRAYLRSVLDQTIPARRMALADGVDHFREAQASDDRGWADMAFLGVIAEAMQTLEDLAYVGESFSINRLGKLPFYVGAITYGATVPSTFYSRKRTDDDLRVVAGYAVRDPASSAILRVADHLFGAQLPADVSSAWAKAEQVTIDVLREALTDLAETWRKFGKYFHAFKHGGLVASRPDFEIVSDDGVVLTPAIAVWVRKKQEPQAHGTADPELDVAEVVAELEQQATIALEILEMFVVGRLAMTEQASAGPPSDDQTTLKITLPVRFRVGPDTLDVVERAALETIGIRFSN